MMRNGSEGGSQGGWKSRCPRTASVTLAALGETRRGSQARVLQLVPLIVRVLGVHGTTQAVAAALLFH